MGQRVVPLHEVGHADELPCGRQRVELLRVGQRRGQRLLHEHVLSGQQGRGGLAVVHGRRGGDVEQVDVRTPEDRVGGHGLGLQFGRRAAGRAVIDVGDRGDGHIRQLPVLGHREPGEGAAADEAHAERSTAEASPGFPQRLDRGGGQ